MASALIVSRHSESLLNASGKDSEFETAYFVCLSAICVAGAKGRWPIGQLAMLHRTRLPNFTGARMAVVTLPVEEASGASSTHAEHELAAFEAASRRSKASITKLSTLGAGNFCVW